MEEQRTTAVFAPRMLDPASGRMVANVRVAIQGERIESVTAGLPEAPRTGKAIELPDSWTLLPGLIDGHTHLFLQPEDCLRSPLLYKSVAYRTAEAVAAARRTLEAGFTTVRDVDSEGAGFADVALREAVRRGVVPGPRMFVAGMPLTVTGGYMTSLGYSPEIELPDLGVAVDSPEAMVAAVRRNVKHGVDLIKVYATGSLPQVSRAGLVPSLQFSRDDMRRIVEEAARWGRDVAAHAYGGEPARNAVLGGARSIEHGILLEEGEIALMVEHGVYYCPTLHVYSAEPGLESNGEEFMERIRARHRQAFQAACRAGAKIVFGTDAGGFEHGRNAAEFGVMTEYGMSPIEAIRSATVRAAELLRRENELGAIAAGAYADLVAVRGNPLEDIGAMSRVGMVMKGGEVVRLEPLAESRTQGEAMSGR